MNDASSTAREKLLAASRSKDKSRRLSVALGIIGAALGIILFVALVDYWLTLSVLWRALALALVALLVGRGVYQFWQSLRAPTRLKDAALDAEGERPEFGCEISTAAEYLTGERKAVQQYEAELAGALQQKAASALEKIELPYWKRPLAAALTVGVITVAFLLFGVIASGAFTVFRRAAVPWSNAAYTQVEVKPGNVELPVGKDLEVKSTFLGRVPRDPKFEWFDAKGARWEAASLARSDQGDYVHPLKNVLTPVKYRVSGGDAVSPAYTVETYLPPEVKSWRVDLQYPAYTERPGFTQSSPDITVLRASKADFQITPNVKLSKALLRFKELAPIELHATPDGFWSGALSVTKETDYWVELVDEKGHRGTNESPYHIKPLPDLPPNVEIPEPGGDMRTDGSTNLPVKISVSDDFGLREVKLVYHRLGSSEEFITSARKNETNTEFATEVPLTKMGLKEYELVAYHAEATDNNSLDGPGVGKSQVYFVEINNEEGCLCKKPGPPGQKVNLLVIQKQIIADTAGLKPKALPDKFKELAARQKDAIDFGNIYLQGMQTTGAPEEAVNEMQAALKDMAAAQGTLEQNQREGSLPPEESALAHLYHILKSVPELKDLPTAPPPLAEDDKKPQTPLMKVVLDAIKKQPKEQPNNQELEQALNEAKELEQKTGLVIGSQNSGSGKASAEVKMDRGAKSKKPNAGKEGKEGEAKAEANAQKPGEGKGEGEGKKGQNPKDGKDAKEVAQKEKELSKEAKELADKLQRLAGKDSRLGHGAAKKMGEAAEKLDQAAQAAQSGDAQTSGTKGLQGDAAMNSAIAMLERILANRPELRDVAKEDFPREYEAEIAEYLKKLSYAE
jgi:hypothetical protein